VTAQSETIRGRAMPVIDHSLVTENLWVVVAISVGAGGLIGEIAGFVHGNLGCGLKLAIMAAAALVIFGSIWFFAPSTGA
jgi:hypothetical protein